MVTDHKKAPTVPLPHDAASRGGEPLPDASDPGAEAEVVETCVAETCVSETGASEAHGEDGAGTADERSGPQIIAGYLKTLTAQPGVYRMLDSEGTVIYVGKARNLKARVSNYARMGGHTNRIARMILATRAMEFVTVRTEAEALLLEANLIKRFRPRFNVLMRDDKSFPFILIRRDHKAAQILKHRGARTGKGEYFGPFASAGAVNRAINTLQRAFLLRSCSDSVYDSRTRPCLLFQIKRCSGPCTGEIAEDDYGRLVEEACRFLRGESQEVRTRLQGLMMEASDRLEYERAAGFRNRLQALAHVTADQTINPDGVEEADIFALHQEGGQTCIQVFFFRSGQNWGNRAYFPKADRSLGADEVMESFIAQFYDDKPVPRLILLSHEPLSKGLLEDALSLKAERRIEIRVPRRGAKTGLVEHALSNAREALGRRLAESSSQRRLLEGVAQRFGLGAVPRRIEVYDNSHIMGTNAVGGMIVAGHRGFAKAHYRRFNIKNADTTPGDDYAMMREVLTRRFKKLAAKEASAEPATDDAEPHDGGALDVASADTALPESVPGQRLLEPAPPPRGERGADAIAFGVLRADPVPVEVDGEPESDADDEPDDGPDMDEMPDRPDLVLIDGGAGQLGVAREVLAALGLDDIALVGVAKGPDRDAGREHFHVPGRALPFMLEPRDPVLYFVQRLRDEAHRFAIGAHRAKRAKAVGSNPLDEIAGIGPGRKRALLTHFGSAKAVSRASVEDLEGVNGISAEMARRIYSFFNEKT
ncbi:MAG: excinuclease ABC subunit UvrC [Hyphomicrobiaceae bacterium]